MLSSVKENVGDSWDEVKSVANQFFQRRKDRLSLLADLRLSGDLNHEKFISRLDDEKKIAEAEFHAIAVISKAIAQKAANAALDVFQKAVELAVSIP